MSFMRDIAIVKNSPPTCVFQGSQLAAQGQPVAGQPHSLDARQAAEPAGQLHKVWREARRGGRYAMFSTPA